MTSWTAADIPDQTGRVFVVAGANSGIGREAATELARRGAHVVLAGRDRTRAEEAAGDIPGSHEVRTLVLADLDSLRAFADGVSDWRIETLVNKAGIMAVPLGRTAQGHELQFGTNVVGTPDPTAARGWAVFGEASPPAPHGALVITPDRLQVTVFRSSSTSARRGSLDSDGSPRQVPTT